VTRTSIEVSLRHANAVSKELLSWFESAGRCFPWRLQRDPFAILIAEKLLQQTAARQVVIDAYRALLSRYPTAVDLATADVRILKKFIRPLGLAYRAQELRSMGRALVSEFDGIVPSELKDLLLLPGVGDYAARAVLSFAFDRDVPIVDTNVARFLYRLFGISAPFPANPSRKKSLIELATYLIPEGNARKFNFAILDLCAAICRPARPLCEICPVRHLCAFALSQHNEPRRRKGTSKR
jgi:A/G-specific adenine glycosylase